MERDHIPAKALLAPLLLVVVYAAAVVALPAVPAANVWSLATGHLIRNSAFLGVAALIACSVFSVSALVDRERRRAIQSELRAYFASPGLWLRLGRFALPSLYLALLLAAFSSFKQLALPSAGFGLDAAFAELDRLVFFGVDPWRLTHWLVPTAMGTLLIDTAYMLWFLPMILIVLLSWMAPARLQTQYLLAFAMIWIVGGTGLAYLLPGAGPCYFATFHGDAAFSPLLERLHAQDAMLARFGGLKALIGQDGLLLAYQSHEFLLAGGISAMPSLHVALATLFACAGFACHRRAGWTFTGFAVLIWFGSVHLGWHYAVDGVLGALLAVATWRLAGVWTHSLYTQPESQRERNQPVTA